MNKKATPVVAKALLALVVVLASRAGARAQQASYELGLGWAGVFPQRASSYGGGVRDQPTDSGAFIASLRWIFRPHHGLEFRYGRTHNSQIFLINGNQLRIMTTASEWMGGYVFRPLPSSKLHPFLTAGAGVLRFSVGNTYINGIQSDLGASGRSTVAFGYGAGIDYPLWRVLALRLEYHGLFFRQPDFGEGQFFTGSRTHLAEPGIGLVFEF